jgi:hypothetical protein
LLSRIMTQMYMLFRHVVMIDDLDDSATINVMSCVCCHKDPKLNPHD